MLTLPARRSSFRRRRHYATSTSCDPECADMGGSGRGQGLGLGEILKPGKSSGSCPAGIADALEMGAALSVRAYESELASSA